jgi:RNA polymerase sigma-70 factor (ECF subfamily)
MNTEEFQKKVFPLKNKLFRFSYSFLKSSEDARDVVQEVMMKIWDRRDEMREVLNWEAWMMRMTRNMSLDKLKSKHRQWSELDKLPLVSGGSNPQQITESRDMLEIVKKSIATLPVKQQQVIRLRDMEGYTYKEISELLEIDISQVKVYLFRARKKVREQLLKTDAYGL